MCTICGRENRGNLEAIACSHCDFNNCVRIATVITVTNYVPSRGTWSFDPIDRLIHRPYALAPMIQFSALHPIMIQFLAIHPVWAYLSNKALLPTGLMQYFRGQGGAQSVLCAPGARSLSQGLVFVSPVWHVSVAHTADRSDRADRAVPGWISSETAAGPAPVGFTMTASAGRARGGGGTYTRPLT